MQTRLFGWVTLAVCTAWSAPAWAECSKDTDCKGDRVCSLGQCVSPSAAVSSAPGESAPAPAPLPPPSDAEPQEQSNPPQHPQQNNNNSYPPPERSPPRYYRPPPGPPPPYYSRPYRRYEQPPPTYPVYYDRKIFAARFGLLGGLGTTTDQNSGSEGRFVIGITGGLGFYLGPEWGLMLAGTANLNYPSAAVGAGQIFMSTRQYWGALGLGVGSFQTPFNGVDTGFAIDGILLYKIAPIVGVGVQLQTIQDPGFASYFSAQAALQFVY